MDGEASHQFRAGTVDVDGFRIRYRDAGQGEVIVDLSREAQPTRFHELLAATHRILVVEPGAAPFLDRALAKLNVDRFSLIVRAAAPSDAIGPALQTPASVRALILISPTLADPAPFAALDLPVLVLAGTRGASGPQEAGRHFREHLKNCHFVLVYDAGDALEADRPEAVAAVVADFVERHDRFMVTTASGVIHP
jgi:pimeloyl-ACP methyl ester carboxylesterase